jgi:hypothetical protein
MSANLRSIASADHAGLGEMDFHRMMSIERRRTSRSNTSFLLMLLDLGQRSTVGESRTCLRRILSAMPRITRETDIAGWYKENSIIGVMFTEITFDDQNSIPPTMLSRVHEMLKRTLSTQQLLQIRIEFQVLPEAKNDASLVRESFSPVYAKRSIPTVVAESSL